MYTQSQFRRETDAQIPDATCHLKCLPTKSASGNGYYQYWCPCALVNMHIEVLTDGSSNLPPPPPFHTVAFTLLPGTSGAGSSSNTTSTCGIGINIISG